MDTVKCVPNLLSKYKDNSGSRCFKQTFGIVVKLTKLTYRYLLEKEASVSSLAWTDVGLIPSDVFVLLPSAALACTMGGLVYTDNSLSWERPGIGQMALYLFVEALVLFILVLLIEVRLDV